MLTNAQSSIGKVTRISSGEIKRSGSVALPAEHRGKPIIWMCHANIGSLEYCMVGTDVIKKGTSKSTTTWGKYYNNKSARALTISYDGTNVKWGSGFSDYSWGFILIIG